MLFIVPAPDRVEYERRNFGEEVAVTVRWGDLRHGENFNLDRWLLSDAGRYFQSWIDKNKHRISQSSETHAGA